MQTVQPSSDLHVIEVDVDRMRIKVGSKATDPQTKLYQVNSEDARVLAMQAARDHGFTNNAIKRHGLQYGDDEKGVPNPAPRANDGSPMHPFLVVELSGAKTGGSGYVGDSVVRR